MVQKLTYVNVLYLKKNYDNMDSYNEILLMTSGINVGGCLNSRGPKKAN
jgi:hypothetical protein